MREKLIYTSIGGTLKITLAMLIPLKEESDERINNKNPLKSKIKLVKIKNLSQKISLKYSLEENKE